ncbi:TPA: hypothetical protein ACJYRC_002211, partial [Neisseria gonorrhoeae]
ACAGMTGFEIAVLSGMTVRVFYCARPAPVNGGRLKMPSEGSDGIGVGESAGRSNRTVIPAKVGI